MSLRLAEIALNCSIVAGPTNWSAYPEYFSGKPPAWAALPIGIIRAAVQNFRAMHRVDRESHDREWGMPRHPFDGYETSTQGNVDEDIRAATFPSASQNKRR